MNEYNPKEALLSLHLFKTGGASFAQILQDWFGEGFIYHHIHHDTGYKPERFPIKHPEEAGYSVPVCLHGHFDQKAGVGILDYYPESQQIITFVRDPLECHLSAYYYQKEKFERNELYWHGELLKEFPFGDLENFFEKFGSFLFFDMPCELTLDNYREALSEKFIHIGVTEAMQTSVNMIAEKLGKPKVEVPRLNTSSRGRYPSEAIIRDFKARHPVHYAVYEWALAMNKE